MASTAGCSSNEPKAGVSSVTQTLDVSVNVSQILRDLLAGKVPDPDLAMGDSSANEGDVTFPSDAAAAEVTVNAQGETQLEAATDLPPDEAMPGQEVLPPEDPADHWPDILLRRDGARPLRFKGQPIVAFSGACDLGGWGCTQDVTLFLAQHDRVFIGLSLHPPDGMGARPVYDCFEVSQEPIDQVLTRWSSRVRGHVPLQRSAQAPPPPRIKPAEITAGFHTLTAHCFRAEQAHPERTEECRQ